MRMNRECDRDRSFIVEFVERVRMIDLLFSRVERERVTRHTVDHSINDYLILFLRSLYFV